MGVIHILLGSDDHLRSSGRQTKKLLKKQATNNNIVMIQTVHQNFMYPGTPSISLLKNDNRLNFPDHSEHQKNVIATSWTIEKDLV